MDFPLCSLLLAVVSFPFAQAQTICFTPAICDGQPEWLPIRSTSEQSCDASQESCEVCNDEIGVVTESVKEIQKRLENLKKTLEFIPNLTTVTSPSFPPPQPQYITPFNVSIPFNTIEGKNVTFHGIPIEKTLDKKYGYTWVIDFQTNSTPRRVFLRFTPHPAHDNVRLNYFSASWKIKTRTVVSPNPFVVGVPFKLVFFVSPEDFQVKLNGKVFATYRHHLRPLKDIAMITVFGNVNITGIEFK